MGFILSLRYNFYISAANKNQMKKAFSPRPGKMPTGTFIAYIIIKTPGALLFAGFRRLPPDNLYFLEAALQRAADLTRLQLGLGQEESQPGAEELTAASAAGADPSGGAEQRIFDSLDANQDGVVANEKLAAFLKTVQDRGERADSNRAITKLQTAISAYNAQYTLAGGGSLDLAA
jgi:hypothetical protein